MTDQQIYFELNQLVERAEACHENFKLQEAKRIVKRTKFLYELITRLIIEANTTKELTNLANNELTKKQFEAYIDNLIIMEQYCTNFISYDPKTKTGYYMFMKDMLAYAANLNDINKE